MTEVQALIKMRLRIKELSYRPCAIFMGRTGAGKTTMISILCGTAHGAGEGRGSVTRNLFQNNVSCGNYIYSLIDTPGTDSSTETYKHALLLREALTALKINTIFIIIKYDARFEEECPNVTNLIFCSELSSKEAVAKLMYRCISNMRKEELEINDTDFFLKFNIYEMRSQMKVSFGEYKKKTEKLVQDYTKFIRSVQSESEKDRDQILHMTIVQFKEEVETLLEEFREQHGSVMQELDYYAFYIKMEKENVRICDEFVEKVAPLMTYNLFDNKDPRNLIKRCPRCE